jgi:ABC-2 type transport system ATP-binding protein
VPGVQQASTQNGAAKLTLAGNTRPQEVLQALVTQGVVLERFEIAIPTLDEIFIRVVEEGDAR